MSRTTNAPATSVERSLRIGEVAERLGITTRTIRYYEERGLLGRDSARAKGSHRVYGEGDVARLRELLRLRDLLGLSLDGLVALAEAEEARAELRDRWARVTDDDERRRIVDAAIPLVARQLALVAERRRALDEFGDELSAKLRALEERRTALADGAAGGRA